MNEFLLALHEFGAWFTGLSHLDVTSIFVGVFFAYVVEIPLISKLRKR